MDYSLLRREGIAFLQESCGDVWTDYNEHDPGVTMLEQLCYALTSLTYLAGTPVRDLLIEKQGMPINTNRQALYTPRQIYPVNPLTVDDYRKLLLDRLSWIGNVWLQPLAHAEVHGLYKIQVYVPVLPEKLTVEEELRRVYAAHRNLCEDVGEIRVLKHAPVVLYGDIAFGDAAVPESLLAMIFFRIGQLLAPEVRRYSLETMLAGGLSADALWEGPLLLDGFIREEELTEKAASVSIYELERVLLDIPGIGNVRNVQLEYRGDRYGQKLAVPADSILTLDSRPLGGGRFSVRFYKNGIEYKPDPARVQRELSLLYQQARMRYKLDQQYERFFGVPAGQYKPVGDYYSIQEQFPQIYGINRYGIPDTDPPGRKAEAKQLKAYLLVFEQLMADFQAQLAHARELFSIDPTSAQTYFYQGLENIVPGIRPILKDGELAYEEGLARLIGDRDNYSDRRNRFLDFLLAMYAEEVSRYAVFSEPALADTPLAHAKQLLLKHLLPATRDRGRAFDYLLDKPCNIAGMEWKVRILLRLPLPEDCCKEANGDQLYIIENILLRPGLWSREDIALPGGEGTEIGSDPFPYSFHLTVILGDPGENPDYREFAERTIAENLPAHLEAGFFWLTPPEMLIFAQLYRIWIAALAHRENRQALTAAPARSLIQFLQKIKR